MMPGNVLQLELAGALGDRRRLVLRTGISLLLALPFIFADMPSHARAAGLTMVVLFTSFFGAAVHHARLRADGRLARLRLLPARRGLIWFDLALASMLARVTPSLVVLASFVLANGSAAASSLFRDLVGVTGLLCGALLLLTLLGMAVGRLAHGNGEVHLFGALTAGLLAFASGVAPLPARLGWVAAIVPWNPVARLLGALTAISDGRPAVTAAELRAASLVLVVITVAVVQRWASGRRRYRGRNIEIDYQAPVEASPQ